MTHPTLLILGTYDFFNPFYLWEQSYSAFKELKIYLCHQSGHNPQLEELEKFDHVLMDWVKFYT